MNICILGDFSENYDEGFKNVSCYLADSLSARNLVVRINVKRLGRVGFWNAMRNTNPQIIHTIAQPTDQSLIFTKLLKMRWPSAQTVISVLRPENYFRDSAISQKQKLLFRFVRPDLVLVQCDDAKIKFRALGCNTNFLSNGVDLERFKPASEDYKQSLRVKHGIHPNHPVVLHVGHIETARNLSALIELPKNNIQVVVVGSQYLGANDKSIDQLYDSGFHVILGYQPQIEEFYMLADCYIFPVMPGFSISMPLSILEAMACNLAIATTRFQGLENVFEEGNGFKYFRTSEKLLDAVKELLRCDLIPETRKMVNQYSWEAVTSQLEKYYEKLLER
jgi:glycosyltransferase involved in cell wall biosynthesis